MGAQERCHVQMKSTKHEEKHGPLLGNQQPSSMLACAEDNDRRMNSPRRAIARFFLIRWRVSQRGFARSPPRRARSRDVHHGLF